MSKAFAVSMPASPISLSTVQVTGPWNDSPARSSVMSVTVTSSKP